MKIIQASSLDYFFLYGFEFVTNTSAARLIVRKAITTNAYVNNRLTNTTGIRNNRYITAIVIININKSETNNNTTFLNVTIFSILIFLFL